MHRMTGYFAVMFTVQIIKMKTFISLLLLFFSVQCFGQTVICGTVKDEKDKPIAGASVSIADSYDGTTTDSLGNFRFTCYEVGKQLLLVSAIGFGDYADSVLTGSGEVTKHITLKGNDRSLDAVIITAGTFAAGDQRRSSELSALDIVTTASANADITGAIKTLPGTQQVGESEGLFVRGGTSNESKVYMDGTLVNKFYFTSQPGQATRGRFNPVLFKGTIFSSGGYSALYGQALSGVLLLESVDLPERTSGSVNVSYLSAGAGIQKLSKDKRSSWGVNYGYTNLGLVYNLIKQKADYSKPPIVNELDLNYRLKTSATGILKYYGYFNGSKLSFRFADVDSNGLKNHFQVKNTNIYQNLSWRESLGSGWKLRLGASYSNNRDRIQFDLENEREEKLPRLDNPLFDNKSFKLNNHGNFVNGRWTLEKRIGGLNAIRFGNEYQYSDELLKYSGMENNKHEMRLKETNVAAYAEGDIYLMSELALRTGFRVEHSAQFDLWNAAPRISLAYQFKDKGQVSIAYGKFYQNPSNKYLPSLGKLHFEQATHYILQYQKMKNSRILRTEIFYKMYDDLIKAVGTDDKLTALNNKGFGDAKGVELFWRDKKSIRNFDYWVSYSYLDTKRDFLNYPGKIQPPFATTHTASVVAKTIVLPWKTQINASYTFATGRPYYDFGVVPSGQVVIRQQGTTKNYNDLSLSLNYLPQLGKQNAKSFSVIVLSVTNVPGFSNVYNYNFSADGTRKLAVTPSAKRFFYLGYFMSFGIDRTQDAIDNHL